MKFQFKSIKMVFKQGKKKLAVLGGVSFEIKDGEILTIIGPSGCGKTTLLKVIANLLKPNSGKIRWFDINKDQARIILVWQDHRLFPWRTVLGNVSLSLGSQDLSPLQRKKIALHYLKMVGLSRFKKFYPFQLSVGMKQRVALARALAANPDLLLLDEPFASLDCQSRQLLLQELKKIQKKTHLPMVYVTHDIRVATFISDRVLILSQRPARVIKELFTQSYPDKVELERVIQEILVGE